MSNSSWNCNVAVHTDFWSRFEAHKNADRFCVRNRLLKKPLCQSNCLVKANILHQTFCTIQLFFYISYKLVKPKLFSKFQKLLTILALGIETRQTHLVIESSDYDGYFRPIRCSLCVLQKKLIVPNNGVLCENISGGRCRSQPYNEFVLKKEY